MSHQTYLAVDLGAGSGRVVAGHFDGRKLQLEDQNRFPNQGVQLPTGWHWNITELFSNIKNGIAAAAKTHGDKVVSVAVDTWGVDYGLIDERGRLLGLPWMYRDSRTDGLIEEVSKAVPKEELYGRTGIQLLFFNTIFQLAAEARQYPAVLREASQLLFVPDLLTYWLSGERVIEQTIASTSQLLKAGSAEWDLELAAKVGIPAHLLKPVTAPGTKVGKLIASLAAEIGLDSVDVVACGSHDTASAVAGAPARSKNPLFLSSGTWSLLGRELDAPIITDASFAAGFSNEQGLSGTTRFLKNVAGMWLLQECKRNWDAQGSKLHYGELVDHAWVSKAPGLVDPDDASFSRPCDMPRAIADYLRKTGQPVSEKPGDIARVILRSLALKYRVLVNQLRAWMPDLPDTLHIVGGGSQNALLNQMTADATGLTVEAGPIEATATGNIIAQLMARGEISSLEEGREIVRNSFEFETFEPSDTESWNDEEARFLQLIST
ncbi:rhamnulokinase [Terrimicrobium sacchariphilum]|uniref:Rhamnulokinase n=1 Tax=Terrimicrobium sacchariphilum TaxID=690879 RepID=A0A146G3W3_TERSA|nr:rhamnulokinase family protein [Terrimicrobium sacchariphilum]GAT31724.1 rhamnulokinase [Terrimicrobium sacchariphilum]